MSGENDFITLLKRIAADMAEIQWRDAQQQLMLRVADRCIWLQNGQIAAELADRRVLESETAVAFKGADRSERLKAGVGSVEEWHG